MRGASCGVDAPFVALGVLSSAGSAGKSSAAQSRARRDTIRRTNPLFRLCHVAVRFLLADGETRYPVNNLEALRSARAEAREMGDMIFLNMTESRFRCSEKYLLWFAVAARAFPAARYIALGDDDTHISFAHLEADLRTVHAQTGPDVPVLYGLIMWKAFYNPVEMVTHTVYNGWSELDVSAATKRRRIERCREARAAGGNSSSPGCARLPAELLRALELGHVDPDVAPFPMANGPLFAVSRSLAAMLAADPFPPAWLWRLHGTHRVRTALARPGGPRKSSYACWPVVDSILGFWIYHVAVARGVAVTLVNTPFMLQHHPWPTRTHGVFSNSSLVVHGLKKPHHEAFRALAIQRGSGPFVPVTRTGGACGGAGSRGWGTGSPSPLQNWTCCGPGHTLARLRRRPPSLASSAARYSQ